MLTGIGFLTETHWKNSSQVIPPATVQRCVSYLLVTDTFLPLYQGEVVFGLLVHILDPSKITRNMHVIDLHFKDWYLWCWRNGGDFDDFGLRRKPLKVCSLPPPHFSS